MLLQLDHALLITDGILRVSSQSPFKKLISVIWHETLTQHAEPLPVSGDFVPVTLHILQILGEVRVATLKDLVVEGGAKHGLEVDKLGPRLVGMSEDKVGGLLDSAHEGADLVRVLADELLIANVQDRAEAAAAQLSELIDAQHLHIRLGTTLCVEPFLEFDHLDVLEADTRVNVPLDDGLGHIHTAAHGGVVGGSETIVGGELVNLDLAELSHIADALALETAEVSGDAGLLEVHDAGERLVKEAADGQDRVVASLGLLVVNY
jgi:hypothetical protein